MPGWIWEKKSPTMAIIDCITTINIWFFVAFAMIGKEFTLRNQLNELGAIYVSFWYKGDLPPYVQFLVNGQGDTSSTIKDGTNLTRYGTALEDVPQSTEYRRATYVWNSFSASTPFDKFRVRVGRPAGLTGDIVEMKGLEVGYFPKFSADYNVFS